MSTKHTIKRTCLGCKTKKSKDKLLRVVLNTRREVVSDKNNIKEGRGAYLCKDEKANVQDQINGVCLANAIKKNLFKYAFKNKKIKKIKLYSASNSSSFRSC